MDASDKVEESSAAEKVSGDAACACAEEKYGCSHYQRKCSLVV